MELQDLQAAWANYDKKLETSLRLNTTLLREFNLNKVDSALRRLFRFIVFEVLIDLAAVVALGMFIASHVRELPFLVPALGLEICAILALAVGIHQLAALGSVDYSASIVEIQRQVEMLRARRIQITKWIVLLCPLLWMPLLIVGLKGLLGFNAYLILEPGYLAVNQLFGVAFAALLLWVSRRYADRLKGRPFIQRLMDDIAGRSLKSAQGFLKTLSRFEQEA